jgi:hypothetical protein
VNVVRWVPGEVSYEEAEEGQGQAEKAHVLTV